MLSKVYIILLSWNNWNDTLECLESIYRNDYPSYRVIICDNGSHDGSVENIKLWADGKLDVALPLDNVHRKYSHPPVLKPIPYIEYDKKTAEAGGRPDADDVPLILIYNGGNLGFPGGNNVGIRYVLKKNDAVYVWLLNNDTVIMHDALTRLVAKAQSDPTIGAVGSTLLYYHRPGIVNCAAGCQFRKYFVMPVPVLMERPISEIQSEDIHLDFLCGASWLSPVNVIRKVGLLDERYSPIYWEDTDWGIRIMKGGYKNAYCMGSIVYHKFGGSGVATSAHFDYLNMRNAIIFLRLHFRSRALIIGLMKVLHAILYRRRIDRIPLILKGFYDGFVTPIEKSS
jgi:GT2 family glycosyltransferase